MSRFVNRGLWIVALSGLALLPVRPVRADDLPKAEELLDKYVTATGGKEAYEKIKNRVMTGTMKISGQGIEGKITIYQARPNKMYTVVELGGLGKFEEGTDGKTVWEKSFMGPRIKTGDEKANALRDATFDSDAEWRKAYKKVQTVGEEKVDGKPCYKVELTTPEGKTRTAYYDKQTGLVTKMVSTEKTPMGNLTVETILSDYKKEDGILMPHKTQQKMAGRDITVTFDKVEQNTKIPDNRFDLPEEIKKLAEKDK